MSFIGNLFGGGGDGGSSQTAVDSEQNVAINNLGHAIADANGMINTHTNQIDTLHNQLTFLTNETHQLVHTTEDQGNKIDILGKVAGNHETRIEGLETTQELQTKLTGAIVDHIITVDERVNSHTDDLLAIKHEVFPHDYSAVHMG